MYIHNAKVREQDLLFAGLDSTTTSSLVKLVSPFFGRTLRVVLSGCGCVLRLRPSRFPFSFFRRRRRAARRPRPPLSLFPLVLSSLLSLQLFPLFRLHLSAPLVLLAFSAVRRPRPPCAPLRLPRVPSYPHPGSGYPAVLADPPHFFHFFLVSLMLT